MPSPFLIVLMTGYGMILFIKHIDIEGPETLGPFFVEKGYAQRVVNLYDGEHLPLSFEGIDAVISLGGPMNVYEEEEYPFLKKEDAFLKKVIVQHVPFLGICLGSQLLAKAAGGSVVRSPEEEIGWFDIELTAEGCRDPLFKGLPSQMEVYQWHGDMCAPPAGAVLLARSKGCPVQAFRMGHVAYGLQFHAEITDKSIKDWTKTSTLPGREEVMLRRYAEVKGVFHGYGRGICENFLKVMKEK